MEKIKRTEEKFAYSLLKGKALISAVDRGLVPPRIKEDGTKDYDISIFLDFWDDIWPHIEAHSELIVVERSKKHRK